MKKEHIINIVGAPSWYVHEYPDGSIRGSMSNPEGFQAVYDKKDGNHISFFVNDAIRNSKEYESEIKIAYISENRAILNSLPAQRNNYIFLENNHDDFDYVATYDDFLIQNMPEKSLVVPYNTTFIWPEERQQIYNKTRLYSYVTSTKSYTKQQQFRVNLLKKFKVSQSKKSPDLFGRGHNPMPESRLGKYLSLKDYAFSINIENMIQDNYFSEKIIDCFLCGTIPIYFGARKINDFFNPRGILTFDNESDLDYIIDNISLDLYQDRIEAVRENHEIAKKHTDSINYLYNIHLKQRLQWKK
tara:strand:- start:594 stop:1496 length:903 start_codon:yes stop_codon:yes gene_type:complete